MAARITTPFPSTDTVARMLGVFKRRQKWLERLVDRSMPLQETSDFSNHTGHTRLKTAKAKNGGKKVKH